LSEEYHSLTVEGGEYSSMLWCLPSGHYWMLWVFHLTHVTNHLSANDHLYCWDVQIKV
jgi:hypothetical protein